MRGRSQSYENGGGAFQALGMTATLESCGQGRSDGNHDQRGIGSQVTGGFFVQERGPGFMSVRWER